MTNRPGDPDQPEDPYRVPPAQSDEPGQGQGYGQPGSWEPPAQAPYGQLPYPQYGEQGYGGYPAPPPENHGSALAAMIVGIASLVLGCTVGIGLLGSPVAWWLGAKAKREIDASQGRLGGRGMAQAGFILGIIGTVLLALGIVAVILIVVVAATTGFSTSP
jgi:hypothetical protein